MRNLISAAIAIGPSQETLVSVRLWLNIVSEEEVRVHTIHNARAAVAAVSISGDREQSRVAPANPAGKAGGLQPLGSSMWRDGHRPDGPLQPAVPLVE